LAEKGKYMVMSRHQNARHHNLAVANKSFENLKMWGSSYIWVQW